VQLVGVRGAPGNTVNHPTSYWIPAHTPRVFVERVDVVSGVGYDHAAAAGPSASEFHRLHRVVTDLAVLDFETPDHRMRLRSVHPGVTVDEVVAATGFELVIPDEVPETPRPTERQLALLRHRLDPGAARNRELRR
jgi:acyl CoA:acetate/3-ketoacid CoA transferase beta subunit